MAENLEAQLRGLILRPGPDDHRQNQTAQGTGTGSDRTSFASTSTNSALKGQASQGYSQDLHGTEHVGGSTYDSGVNTPRYGKKRLNQAQRRQLSSQLSIPIDPRAQAPPIRHGQHLQNRFSLPTTAYSSFQQQVPVHHGKGGERRLPPATSDGHSAGQYHRQAHHDQRYPSQYHAQSHHLTNHNNYNQQAFAAGPRSQMNLYHQTSDRNTQLSLQTELLDRLAPDIVYQSEIQRTEIVEKEAFRQLLESICRDVVVKYEIEHAGNPGFVPNSVELTCFGSLSSGFATRASDMDLALTSPLSHIAPDAKESQIPRLLEKALLQAQLGARLLTRTRVPIIKLCQLPPAKLYQDLVAEREKWENSHDLQLQDAKQEAEDDEEVPLGREEGTSVNGPGSQAASQATTYKWFTVPSADNSAEKSFHLEQTAEQTIDSYHALAKRLLRKAGGRTADTSNVRNFSQIDWVILNRVCLAFLEGLNDSSLQERISMYPYFSTEAANGPPRKLSLQSAMTIVRGEQMIQACEQSQLSKVFYKEAKALDGATSSWHKLLWRSDMGSDPVADERAFQRALHDLTGVSILPLSTLKQGQEESVEEYYHRASTLINKLEALHGGLPRDMQQCALDCYVGGIFTNTVRKSVDIALKEQNQQLSIRILGQRHASLQLAQEFETAITKKVYEGSDIDIARQYIALLHHSIDVNADFNKSSKGSGQIDEAGLVAKVRKLKDPRPAARNLPRDSYRDRLEFPKDNAGVQCDINFSAHLALHNTKLLRCYSAADSRVRPLVLFVKRWANIRGVNSGYRGTLSSYGYVLMVLHYLVNVAQPFVCPNLQQLGSQQVPGQHPGTVQATATCRGHNVEFWKDEQEIGRFAQANQLTQNNESVGSLLRGFFEYYAQTGTMSNGTGRGFDWGRDVLSLRTPGGLLSKQSKGWTGAKTVVETAEAAIVPGHMSSSTDHPGSVERVPHQQATLSEQDAQPTTAPAKATQTKEVRLRYLFAIEDPFETDHNVARTVTHNGIVSIRDEFRRALRIIRAAGHGENSEELLEDIQKKEEDDPNSLTRRMATIHGPAPLSGMSQRH